MPHAPPLPLAAPHGATVMPSHMGPGNMPPYPHHHQQPISHPPIHYQQPPQSPLQPNGPATTRAHPHLPSPLLFISHVPADLQEKDIVKIISDCIPVRINLRQVVPPDVRVSPDSYYEWMPRNGTLEFENMLDAERALAVLNCHPIITIRGVLVSSYPDAAVLPSSQSRARFLRPMMQRTREVPASSDPVDIFMAQCPSPTELFNTVRPWGSVREIRVWTEHQESGMVWAARVEFWYEDEARRFEIEFGRRALTLKGWLVHIGLEQAPEVPEQPMILPPGSIPVEVPLAPFQANPYPAHSVPFTPATGGNAIPPLPQIPFPASPPPLNYTPPWASHNPFTIKGTDVPAGFMPHHLPLSPPATATPMNIPLPDTPFSDTRNHSRHRSNSSKTSLGSVRQSARQRTWSATLEEGPDGEMRPTGFVADDGMAIHHGPGQHIRPAPFFGPGSMSQSGLVDYSNVFVKNRDSDINSAFLSDHFAEVGRIVSARVMRDNQGRSRGYGFVSFYTPAEASRAIEILDGTKLGRNMIAVTLHEPRKLRPEKIAERIVSSPGPTAYGRSRRSHSPVGFRRGVQQPREPQPPAVTDQIRSLSPVSRKAALIKRVTPIVQRYAQVHSVPEGYRQPTIDALAGHDLALIPLLHDTAALNARIAETVSVLQGDPELDINLSTAQSRRITPPTEAEIGLIRDEIAKIDPTDVGTVMPIVTRNMTGEDVQLCLDSRSALAGRYNAAKRVLVSQRGEEVKAEAPQRTPEVVRPVPSDPDVKPFERVELSSATIELLAAMSATEIVANLKGGDGDALLGKLGLSRPSVKDKNLNEAWMNKTLPRGLVERKTEMANMLAKKVETTLKRSQKVKLAKEIVNAEPDEKALCALMVYPAILDAKLRAVMGNDADQRD